MINAIVTINERIKDLILVINKIQSDMYNMKEYYPESYEKKAMYRAYESKLEMNQNTLRINKAARDALLNAKQR